MCETRGWYSGNRKGFPMIEVLPDLDYVVNMFNDTVCRHMSLLRFLPQEHEPYGSYDYTEIRWTDTG
jgi:hypothetical protein